MENGEWGMGNGEWGMQNGEWGMGSGQLFEFKINLYSEFPRVWKPRRLMAWKAMQRAIGSHLQALQHSKH